ncbi:MAG: dihydropteroate synthase [Caryophanon sp.]|nr:dihydropteroate synthase [Caryophanon sp.]
MALQQYEPLTINGVTLDFSRETFVMGILNVTPDSFSDGGQFNTVEAALAQAKQMAADGAKIIDVGGESTRPGYTRISDDEEILRITPVIKAIVRDLPNVIVSVDTYKANVAQAAIDAGAHIINDIWGAKADPQMAHVAAKNNVPIILMHNRADEPYTAYWENFMEDMHESIRIVKAAGVPDTHIFLDPGIGFVKNLQQSIETMQKLPQLVALGYPVLLATSRKRLIGAVLDLPVEERLEGTLATCAFGVQSGCHIMRVHDVKETVRTVKMMDALVGKYNVEGELAPRH